MYITESNKTMKNTFYQKQTEEQRAEANALTLFRNYKVGVLTLTEYVTLCNGRGYEIRVNVEHEKRYNSCLQ